MARALTSLFAICCFLAVALAAAGCMSDDGSSAAPQAQAARIPQATEAELEAAGLARLPLAAESERVDFAVPTFSNPTKITNPLFPISRLHSAILNGTVDDKRFRVETTLLPETRIIEWPEGRRTETLVSQYVAYLDGRIEEVALDFYAQADDGSVWYFGEDVFNYKDGLIGDTEGTWIAGNDGPAAMIMPADPQIGDVYRPENVPGFVFEEVTVRAVGETVAGPRGPIEGAIVAEELHQDGAREDKTFTPGYGEFFTGSGGDVEALALAVPTDALGEEAPAELEALLIGANDIVEQAQAGNRRGAQGAARTVTRAWESLNAGELPPRLRPFTAAAVKTIGRAVEAGDAIRTQQAAIDLVQAALDLDLQHRPPAEIDRARFELWARQLALDARARDAGAVSGDLATLEWIRDRIAHTLDRIHLIRIDTLLVELRTKLNEGELRAAPAEAEELGQVLGG